MSDFPTTSLRGLPGPLPPGERLLWQGTPDWRSLARHAFHIRKLALYFLLMLAVVAAAKLQGGAGVVDAAIAVLWLAPFAFAAIGLVALFAWLIGRTTVYSLTNRRVVLHVGIALPITFNLPFQRLAGAALREHRDGSGDIPLQLKGEDRIAWLHLWPHARPWHLKRPEPMLRAVPDAAAVAELLADAVTFQAVDRRRASTPASAQSMADAA